MHRNASIVLASVAIQLAALGSPVYSTPNRPPNVVVLLADDLGYGELGCQGNPEIPTPNIDSIAQNGIRCTQAYVTAPNCSPSRAGFLTGRIPTRFGYEFNPIGARNGDVGTGLPRAEITLAEFLHDRGYLTGLFGKWHLGGAPDYHPLRHGFDEFFGFLHEGHYYVPAPWNDVITMLRRKTLPGGGSGRWISPHLVYSTHMGHNEPPYDANNPILRGGQPVVEKKYLTDALAREAVDFIERHRDEPFFLYLAFNAVHSPMQAPDASVEAMEDIADIHRRIFAGMLARLDAGVGAVLDKLRKEGLEENTLVIFFSDNGGPTRELTSTNLPLRGEKGQMYEGGLRIPFLVRWDGVLPAGSIYRNPISSMDIFATAATAAGAMPPPDLDGVNLLPFLTGRRQDTPHVKMFWRQGHKAALRLKEWKLVQMQGSLSHPQWELYNLQNDLAESHNLADTESERLHQLVQSWNELNNQMSPPRF